MCKATREWGVGHIIFWKVRFRNLIGRIHMNLFAVCLLTEFFGLKELFSEFYRYFFYIFYTCFISPCSWFEFAIFCNDVNKKIYQNVVTFLLLLSLCVRLFVVSALSLKGILCALYFPRKEHQHLPKLNRRLTNLNLNHPHHSLFIFIDTTILLYSLLVLEL